MPLLLLPPLGLADYGARLLSSANVKVGWLTSPRYTCLFGSKALVNYRSHFTLLSTCKMSEKILQNLVRQTSLTEDGKNWLVNAIDPFHDTDLVMSGYPDAMTTATVVQLVKTQLTIAAPASAGSSNWDAVVSLFPTAANAQVLFRTAMVGTTLGTYGAVTAPLVTGGLVCTAGPAGAVLYPSSTGSTVNAGATSSYASPAAFTKGQYRIIGAGFEVVNSTAPINQQGQCTVWRMPSVPFNSVVYPNSTPFYPCPYTGSRLPPGTLGEAMSLYGSRSWHAKEGCYVVARQNSAVNNCTSAYYQNILYSDTDFTTLAGAPGAALAYNLYGNHYATAPWISLCDKISPFDLSGATFTGLSNATTLTINVRWLIERVPSPQEPDLVCLATPSSCYDPIALELMTQAMCLAPPGVMLSENPLGEWFKTALRMVADYAPKIGASLSAAGVPFAGTAGHIAGGLAQGTQLILKEKKKRENHKPPLPGSSSSGETRGKASPSKQTNKSPGHKSPKKR